MRIFIYGTAHILETVSRSSPSYTEAQVTILVYYAYMLNKINFTSKSYKYQLIHTFLNLKYQVLSSIQWSYPLLLRGSSKFRWCQSLCPVSLNRISLANTGIMCQHPPNVSAWQASLCSLPWRNMCIQSYGSIIHVSGGVLPKNSNARSGYKGLWGTVAS